jgi:hypothetical protein
MVDTGLNLNQIHDLNESELTMLKELIAKVKPKESCNKCYGRGIVGHINKKPIACRCIDKQVDIIVKKFKCGAG